MLALDSKAASERTDGPNPERALIAAVAHGSGLTIGQMASDSAGGEILGAYQLPRKIPAAGRVMTLDALCSCPETARLITELGADCAMLVKDNRPTLLEDIRLLNWDSAAEFKTSEKGRGRVETRRCRAIALNGFPDELAALPGRRQAFRIVRERQAVRTRKTSVQTVFGLSSPGPERAGPEELPALNRGHWAIENRLRHVRDVSCDEERLRIHSGRLAGNLAGLANAAISIVRLKGRFLHMPQASRHYAARQGDALREITRPGRAAPAEQTGARPQWPVPGRRRTPPNASKQAEKRPSPPSRTQSLRSSLRPDNQGPTQQSPQRTTLKSPWVIPQWFAKLVHCV